MCFLRLLFLAGTFVLHVALSSQAAAQSRSVSLVINGETRSFSYSVPQKSSQLPVILSFHGFGGSAAQQEAMSGLTALAVRNGMVIVYPEGRKTAIGKQYWATQAGQDQQGELAFVRGILSYLAANHSIDPTRIYATGISNGGGMASLVASRMSRRISAIAPVSGAYYDYSHYTPNSGVAVLAFHGTSDRIVPIQGRRQLPPVQDWAAFWAKHNGCNHRPTVIQRNKSATRLRWGGCSSTVTLVALNGGRHAWPGGSGRFSSRGTVDASKEIVEFFLRN